MCSTSWSVRSWTRRSAVIDSFVVISLALAGPMPWIYCSAITTRLLVGRLTPAIRAIYTILLSSTGQRAPDRPISKRNPLPKEKRRAHKCAAGRPVKRDGGHVGARLLQVKCETVVNVHTRSHSPRTFSGVVSRPTRCPSKAHDTGGHRRTAFLREIAADCSSH